MRTFISILFFCLMLAFSAQAQNAKRYAIKSGYLKLELSGSAQGTKELWWDNYGQKTCELEKSISTTKMLGVTSVEEIHNLTIIINDKYWTVDYNDNSGTKGVLPYYNEAQDMVAGLTPSQQKAYADDLLKQMGGEQLGSEKLGNYTCDIISLMGSKSWIYMGIILKSETNVMGIRNYEMYSDFKPNAQVSASKFKAPEDVSYSDMQAAQQQAFGGFPVMEMEEDKNSDTDGGGVAVNYPFDKFKSVIAEFSYPGYVNMGSNSIDGSHAATFMKGLMGMGGSLMIVAESRKNAEPGEHDSYEHFSYNGHECFYGQIEDEDGTVLVVEYANYDMYIVIAGLPDLPKSELLKISDKLKF